MMVSLKTGNSTKKHDVQEVVHNYPFNSRQSSFSSFEEKFFPKILIFCAIISIIILFSIFLNFHIIQQALFFTFIFILLWIIIIGPVIVKLMIRRREKRMGYK